jgi:nitrile hydratase accessory protein
MPFEAPWQAQAFAMVVTLSERGSFTWEHWVQVFSNQIAVAPRRADETINGAYFRQWLEAFESMIFSDGLLDRAAVDARAAEWRLAYLNTPHGQPIDLANAQRPARTGEHDHDHRLARPLAVSPAVPSDFSPA